MKNTKPILPILAIFVIVVLAIAGVMAVGLHPSPTGTRIAVDVEDLHANPETGNKPQLLSEGSPSDTTPDRDIDEVVAGPRSQPAPNYNGPTTRRPDHVVNNSEIRAFKLTSERDLSPGWKAPFPVEPKEPERVITISDGNLSPVTQLLASGWQVKHQSACASARALTTSNYTTDVVYLFTLSRAPDDKRRAESVRQETEALEDLNASNQVRMVAPSAQAMPAGKPEQVQPRP